MIHGGDLREVMALSGLQKKDILDLSTGISPFSYPWQEKLGSIELNHLPQQSDLVNLIQAAQSYYKTTMPMIAASGTQSLISLIPYLLKPQKVWIRAESYHEHRKAWQLAGHEVLHQNSFHDDAQSAVIINPDNPTGHYTSFPEISAILAKVKSRGGVLILDEAFMDATPDLSFHTQSNEDGLIILRSFGKFFGLAGLRLGFAITNQSYLDQINHRLGEWAVGSLALQIGVIALNDRQWIEENIIRLQQAMNEMGRLFKKFDFKLVGNSNLFITITHPQAKEIHHHLASHGIWTRLFPIQSNPVWSDGTWLRFGLCANQEQLKRLENGLLSFF